MVDLYLVGQNMFYDTEHPPKPVPRGVAPAAQVAVDGARMLRDVVARSLVFTATSCRVQPRCVRLFERARARERERERERICV